MTESEAIKQFKERIDIPDYKEQIHEYYEAMEMAINALEKQIPKKIVKYDVCPICNNSESTTWYYVGASYCEFCGQKLDWE